MADDRDRRSLRSDPLAADEGGGGAVPSGPVHARGAGDDGAPVAGRAAPRPGSPLSRGGEADGSVDDDGDARGALAAPWRGRLPAGAGSPEAQAGSDRLKIAIPASGRLREPAVALLEDAGLGPERPGGQ